MRALAVLFRQVVQLLGLQRPHGTSAADLGQALALHRAARRDVEDLAARLSAEFERTRYFACRWASEALFAAGEGEWKVFSGSPPDGVARWIRPAELRKIRERLAEAGQLLASRGVA
jgi:hypothetical protein